MVVWLIGLLLASSIFVIRCCPDTPLAIALRRHLAVEPARWLMERKRSDLFFVLMIGGLAAAGGEVFAVLGPEVVLVYAADLALYLDLVVVSCLVAANSRLKLALSAVHCHVSAIRQRIARATRGSRREARTRSEREVTPSDDDDDASWQGLRLAA